MKIIDPNNYILFDGWKSILLEQYPDEAWKWLSGKEAGDRGLASYYKAVPWLYRGINLRAQAVAGMPFVLLDKSGDDFDISSSWENKLKFMPNPVRLLWLVEAALTLTGKAYFWRDRNKLVTKELRYIKSDTITPRLDPNQGLIGFTRDFGRGPKDIAIEDIVYFWLPDIYVEIGPAENYPAKAALMAAGVLANIDEFIAGYFKRGAIRATIFTAQGMPKGEAEKFESWWKRFVGGVRNAFTTKILNAEKMSPTIVGEGLESLSDTELTKEKREDIATALGIPNSILFAAAANFATAQQDDLNFLSKTIVPECDFIAEVLNSQVFNPLGFRFEFRPETLDAYQEDENQRANSLLSLVNAGMPLLMALDVLGYEITTDQRADLEDGDKSTITKVPQLSGVVPSVVSTSQMPEISASTTAGKVIWHEHLDRWQRKALNRLKLGKPPACEFSSELIPPLIMADIMAGLETALTEQSIKDLFSIAMTIPYPQLQDVNVLLEGIRLGVEALRSN